MFNLTNNNNKNQGQNQRGTKPARSRIIRVPVLTGLLTSCCKQGVSPIWACDFSGPTCMDDQPCSKMDSKWLIIPRDQMCESTLKSTKDHYNVSINTFCAPKQFS